MNIVTIGIDVYCKSCYFYSIDTTDCFRFYHTKELIEYLLVESDDLYFCKWDTMNDDMWYDLLDRAKEEGIKAIIEIMPTQNRKEAIRRIIQRFN